MKKNIKDVKPFYGLIHITPFYGFVLALACISLLSSLRSIVLPLVGDEITYTHLAENIILHGKYHLENKPSSITPVIPVYIALFINPAYPLTGIKVAKLLNLAFILIGIRFCYLFLKKLNLDEKVVAILLLLTVVNNNFILWILRLYPEAIIWCFLWGFLYYLIKDNAAKTLFLSCFFLMILILTRYVYAVLTILFIYRFFNFIAVHQKDKKYSTLLKTFLLLLITSIPLIFWAKFIFLVENEVETSISYFKRFSDHGFFHNLIAGLGFVKHPEAGQINGIPAIISLFVPMHGLRSWFFSLLIVFFFIWGLLSKWKDKNFKILSSAVFLILLGFMLAGTGFSRYWLPILPGFFLGFYLFLKSQNFKDSHFFLLSEIVAIIYVVNELRLDVIILSGYLYV